MKFPTEALDRLNAMLSMKILAGPTLFNDIQSRMDPAPQGKEVRSSDMAQLIDAPSTSLQRSSVEVSGCDGALIIDTGTTTNFVPLTSKNSNTIQDDDMCGILIVNHTHPKGLASSVVGQQKARSSVTTPEQVLVVTKRSNRCKKSGTTDWTYIPLQNREKNTQLLTPPRPEGSHASRDIFDPYMYLDAGLYTYRLHGKTIHKSNSVPAKRSVFSSCLPKSSVKKPFKTRIKNIDGKWITVFNFPNNKIIVAKTGEIIRPTDSQRKLSMNPDEFTEYVNKILAEKDQPVQVPHCAMVYRPSNTQSECLKKKMKALKHAPKVFVFAPPNGQPSYTMTRRMKSPADKRKHNAMMTTTVSPTSSRHNDEKEGETTTVSAQTTPTIRRSDQTATVRTRRRNKGGSRTFASSPSETPSQASTTFEHSKYPSFSSNQYIKQFDNKREMALQALAKWDGKNKNAEIKWIQNYIYFAHSQSQTRYHANPYKKFQYLLMTLSPFFIVKGEQFLKDHFDIQESNVDDICQAINPSNVILYFLDIQQASMEQQHYPFYSSIDRRIKIVKLAVGLNMEATETKETKSATLKYNQKSASFPSVEIGKTPGKIKKDTKKKKKRKSRRRSRRKKSYRQDVSSSSSSSSSSSDSEEESDDAYDSDGNKKTTHMAFSTNRKRKDVQSRKIAKIMKRLHDSAMQFQLKDCSITGGTIENRKSNFHTWIETLRQILCVEWRYTALLARYPLIECQNISTTSNMALAHFLFTKMELSSREEVRFGLDDHLDGVALLQYLQQKFGGTTIDCTKAMQQLMDTMWKSEDTIDIFSRRFLRRVEAYRMTVQNTKLKTHPTLDDTQLLAMYLEALTATMPVSHPLHQTMQNKLVELQSCIFAEIDPSFTLLQIINQMR